LTIVKSTLLKQFSDNYPNFLKKDLAKFVDIIIFEIKQSLKKGERVELRNFGVWSTHIQKARISRNPKTGEKVLTPKKKTIHFKMAKELFKKLNNEE
jgi:integration host factor subunit beta|tara:strand:+ start:8350 stop:8640 length:291 start_codon:yes stop_codon:yes gene_type:complete